MKAQYFVYTRNRDNDYKLAYAPDDTFCPPETRRYFLKQSRGVINIESYSGSLDEPRWFISRKGNHILFGIGVMNRILGADNNTDYTGTPIRGFFGLVINADNQTRVPYDIKFYKDLYKSIIDPVWNYANEDFKFKGVEVTQDFNDYECIDSITCSIELNTDENKNLLLSISTNIADIVGAILSKSADCSFVSGLSDKEHAYSNDYCFHNATIIGTDKRIEKGKVNTDDTDFTHHGDGEEEIIIKPIQLKKAFRPKLIIIIGILAIVLIVLLCKTCQNKQTNLDPSISGDTVQTDTINQTIQQEM
jgi:hypothetical protein